MQETCALTLTAAEFDDQFGIRHVMEFHPKLVLDTAGFADVKTNGLNAPVPDEVYYPFRQLGRPGMAVIAKTDGDVAAIKAAGGVWLGSLAIAGDAFDRALERRIR